MQVSSSHGSRQSSHGNNYSCLNSRYRRVVSGRVVSDDRSGCGHNQVGADLAALVPASQKKSKQLHSTATEHDKCTQHAGSVNDHEGRVGRVGRGGEGYAAVWKLT